MHYEKALRENLRQEMKKRRAQLHFEEISELSAQICARVLAHPLLQSQQTVSSFVSFGHEVSTFYLNIELKRRGHVLGLPVVSPSIKGLMEFYTFKEGVNFIPNRFNILEPPALPERKLDPKQFSLVLLPLTAFDETGARLGMGGGYYDRLLKALNPTCRKIGLAYDFQQATNIPTENWDMPIDEVITPSRHLICAPLK